QRAKASATARYIAPVSRNSKPSRSASFRATVLFPDPAGQSIVTIMGHRGRDYSVVYLENYRNAARGNRGAPYRPRGACTGVTVQGGNMPHPPVCSGVGNVKERTEGRTAEPRPHSGAAGGRGCRPSRRE